MDNKQYNALFSFIWNIANDLPNSLKKGYLILGAYDDSGNVGGKVGGKNGGDNVPSLSPALSPVLSQVVTSLSQVGRRAS